MAEVFDQRFQQTIHVEDAYQGNWQVAPLAEGEIFVVLEPTGTNVSLQIEVQEQAKMNLFVMNRSNQPVQCDVTIHVQKDAHCQMGLLDMEKAPFTWSQHVSLDEEGADFTILSAQLCEANQKKQCEMEVLHNAGHTYGEMRNFAVMLDEGQYEMVANGNIKKGCPEANSHQATRVLTLGKNHNAKCIPLLLIDENEVQASHALTVGQPDEDQLYYLQSRGLTTQQAIGLLSVGYFLPVIELIGDETLQDQVRKEMEGKVGLHGQQ